NGPDEKNLFVKLTNTISVLLAIFVVLRFGELIYRDKLSYAFACLTGIFPKMEAFTPEWTFQLTLNIVTPFVLVGLGLIFPLLARRNT
ncbi:amino acid permease, partial [Salmonella enterica subsp. enterica serovar Cerro]|nr:amino acid permease [Salmonella enterica subsp. enterica serovar Cerro]